MSHRIVKKSIKKSIRPKKPIGIDLFCGCGAMTEGFKQAGVSIIAAIDNNKNACATYRKNHPKVHLIQEDIRLVDPSTLFHGHREKIDIIIVCAPCQPFSSQNRYKKADERRLLSTEIIRFAECLSPEIIVFENVSGLISGVGQPVLKKIQSQLSKLKYKIGSPQMIDAADYLVPQRRRRCIMFATKNGVIPQLLSPIKINGKHKTVKDAIGDLQPLKSGQKSDYDILHYARNHTENALQRMEHIPKNGGNRFSLPSSLELRCHKGKKLFPDVYGRMNWNMVAPTLTTGCTDITKGRFMHPSDNRAITLREAARLQTFPDNYKFIGSSKEIALQIGNAVPILLAKAIGLATIKSIKSGKGVTQWPK